MVTTICKVVFVPVLGRSTTTKFVIEILPLVPVSGAPVE